MSEEDVAESALWLDAVSEAFPDFDFSGCYDFDDLRKHMVGQATRLRRELDDKHGMMRAAIQDAEAAEAELRECRDSFTEVERVAMRVVTAEARCARLLFVAENLFQMVPQSVWRDHGGDDMQGHYEGDYHAEQLREELAGYREALAGLDTPTDDPRCPELNPKSTSEDRCERPAGHSGDHVSVSHSGRVKVYPSKWDTPADSQEGQQS